MTALATCTASPLTGTGKTIRLIPSGLFRATDGRPAGLPGWTLNASNAATIIKAAALRTDDFVIDYEHQTMQASKNGQPAPAAGWFKRLEWREGLGLFAVDVRWTARASAMIIAREYRYVSPVFGFNAKSGEVQTLHAAAITNNPALDGLTDITAAKYAAVKVKAPCTMSHYEQDRTNAVLKHCFGDDAAQFER
jgi:phage I-like protein